MIRRLAVVPLLFLLACQGEKPGDKCDGFFQNTCKAPLSCITITQSGSMFDKKVCAPSCDKGFSCKDPKGCCAEGFTCIGVEIGPGGPGAGLAMGGHCVPHALLGE